MQKAPPYAQGTPLRYRAYPTLQGTSPPNATGHLPTHRAPLYAIEPTLRHRAYLTPQNVPFATGPLPLRHRKRTVAPVDPVETNQTLEPGTLDPGPDTTPRTSVQRTGLITATAPRTARPSTTRLPSGAQEQRIGPTAATAPSTSRSSTTRLPSGAQEQRTGPTAAIAPSTSRPSTTRLPSDAQEQRTGPTAATAPSTSRPSITRLPSVAQAQRTGPIAATAPSSSRPAITRLPSVAQPTTGDDSLAEELAEHQAAIRVSLEKPAV
ncbi:hypothetical protein WAI453_008897 [Rhynchosporium graminicola]